MAKVPQSVDIITYQVGFGDCFLLRFNYARGRPHTALVDFGSTHKSEYGYSLNDVARELREDSGGKLDVVVATHRHKDHVQGFNLTKKGGGTGKLIRSLDPGVVIQPWTEDPAVHPDATGPRASKGRKKAAAAVGRLEDMQRLAGAAANYSKRLNFANEKGVKKSLRVLGDNNLGNARAMKNLREMGRRHYYASHGRKLGLARELPGVKVHVLGPPTLDQSKSISKQRSRDPNEFWHLRGGEDAFWQLRARTAAAAHPQARGDLGDSGDLVDFPDHEMKMRDPLWGRWLRRRLRTAYADELKGIVRSLDKQINNTSLILLFEVGDKRLLFPGDAQYENWMYALDQPWVRKLLRGVDVYKVGHHGSLNATPKSMLDLFDKTTSKGHDGAPMHSLLSSKRDVHGSTERRTEVPRTSLEKALGRETQLHSTINMDAIKEVVTLEV